MKSAARVGRTEKISVSIEKNDLTLLRARALRLHDGNLSAAIAEGIQRMREEEGREALATWIGEAGEASAEEREVVREQWRSRTRGHKRAFKKR